MALKDWFFGGNSIFRSAISKGEVKEYEGNNIPKFHINYAKQIPQLVNDVEKIAGTVAQMPIYIYKENAKGELVPVREHYLNKLLNEKFSNDDNSNSWKKKTVRDMLYYGQGGSVLEKNGTKINSINRVEPNSINKVRYDKTKNGKKTGITLRREYEYMLNKVKGSEKDYNFLYFDFGDGILNNFETLETVRNNYLSINSYFKNSMKLSAHIHFLGNLEPEEFEKAKEDINKNYGGVEYTGAFWITQGKFKPEFDMLKWDNSVLNTDFNKFDEQIMKLTRMYGVKSDVDFRNNVIADIITTIENEIFDKLLTEQEKEEGLYIRFDTSELARPDEKTRMEIATTGLEKGIFSIHEARKIFDLAPFNEENNCDDDYKKLNLGDIIQRPNGTIEILNMAKSLDKDGFDKMEGGVENEEDSNS